MPRKLISLSVLITFVFSLITPVQKAHAQPLLGLPEPGTMVNLSPAYEPVLIKGVTVHKDNPFLFDFIVGVGQDHMAGEALKKEGEKLAKYFLASLAIPDKDVWVNLSPYEKDRTVPETLSQTEMGRDLLAQDYMLKQITASLIYPEKELGKTFWDRVYAKAQQMYGPAAANTVPVNTFNKVWIMADKASVFERNQTAFVVDSHLKVMLEEDYLALTRHSTGTSPVILTLSAAKGKDLNKNDKAHSIASQIVRDIILPELEKEVNTGKNFANLRQIYNSIILASWYKNNLKQAILNQIYTDKAKVKGIGIGVIPAKAGIQSIYERYLQAYKKGVFNYIKEDVNAAQRTANLKKYFSGGITRLAVNPAMASQADFNHAVSDIVGQGLVNARVLTTPAGVNAAMTALQRQRAQLIAEIGDEEIKRRLENILQLVKDAKQDPETFQYEIALTPQLLQVYIAYERGTFYRTRSKFQGFQVNVSQIRGLIDNLTQIIADKNLRENDFPPVTDGRGHTDSAHPILDAHFDGSDSAQIADRAQRAFPEEPRRKSVHPSGTILVSKNPSTGGSLEETHGRIMNKTFFAILRILAPLTEDLDGLNYQEMSDLMKRIKEGVAPSSPNSNEVIEGTDIRWIDAQNGVHRTAPIDQDYLERTSELTGPAAMHPPESYNPAKHGSVQNYVRLMLERNFITINYQLLSKAKTMMFDGEDALGSILTQSLDNMLALTFAFDALDNEKNEFHDLYWQSAEKAFNRMVRDGYLPADFDWRQQLKDIKTKRMFRHRGTHLRAREFRFVDSNGEERGINAALVDLTFYLANIMPILLRQGSTPMLYSPKIPSARIAAVLKRAITMGEDFLGLRRGTIKTTVLIEQATESYQLEGIRAALGENFGGFNTGRWDYIADWLKQTYGILSSIAPNFTQMTMGYGFMNNYEGDVWRAANVPGRIVAREDLIKFVGLSPTDGEVLINDFIKRGYFQDHGVSNDKDQVPLIYVTDKYLVLKEKRDIRTPIQMSRQQKGKIFEALVTHWIGGMEAQIPTVRRDLVYPEFPQGLTDEQVQEIKDIMLKAAATGKIREMSRGAGGFWAAHWAMIEYLNQVVDEFYRRHPSLRGRTNMLGLQKNFNGETMSKIAHNEESDKKLIALSGTLLRTKEEFRMLISVMIYNLNAELTGRAAVASKAADNFFKAHVGWLMDDRATTEGRAKLVREWIHKNAPITDQNGNETGEHFTKEMFLQYAVEEYQKLQNAPGEIVFTESKNLQLPIARYIAEKFVTNDDRYPLPWTVDLVNLALDIQGVQQAQGLIDQYIDVWNSSHGVVRVTENPQFETDQVIPADAAMTVQNEDLSQRLGDGYGGIDLNSAGIKWTVGKDGKGVEMTIDPAMLARFKREGVDSLQLRVLSVTPIMSIWPIIGLQPPKTEDRLAGV